MPAYKLWVHCSRNGISQEMGCHSFKDFPDDAAALEGFKADLKWLGQFYDRVAWKVIEDPTQSNGTVGREVQKS